MRVPANLVRAASFGFGSALAVLLALKLGILEPRRPIQVAPVDPTVTEPTPKVRPIAPQVSGLAAPEVTPVATDRPETPPPPPRRRAKGPSNSRPNKPKPATSSRRPSRSDIDTASAKTTDEALPPELREAAQLMRGLEKKKTPNAGELTYASGALEAAAKKLRREDVRLCLERFYLEGPSKQRRTLLQCWRRLRSGR